MPSEAITLYAKWTINQYTITFDSNDGTAVSEITQDFATSVSAPTNPTRTGYTFAGWFSDEALTTTYTFTTMPSQATTLYAKWTGIPYSISYSYEVIQSQQFNYVSGGGAYSFGLTTPGQVYAWGRNAERQLGDGTTNGRTTPTLISFSGLESGETIQLISLGEDHSLALTTNGRVYGWGSNSVGQLGDGTLVTKNIPTLIPFADLQVGEKIKYVSAGGYHSLALTTNGRVFGWGFNSFGSLGDNTNINKNIPTLISFTGLQVSETIEFISAGSFHSLAVTTNGRLYGWGRNSRGSVGDGTTDNKFIPTLITFTGLEAEERIQDVALNGEQSFALTSLSNVFAWGYNAFGQLGDSTLNDKLTPTPITFTGLELGEKIQYLDASVSHTLALTTTGRVYAWGLNDNGRLGDGTIVNKSIPTLISFTGLQVGETIDQVTTGSAHNLAVTTNGRLFTWGNNPNGQLGDGTTTQQTTPTLINVNALSTTIVNNYHTVNFGDTIASTLPNPTLQGYVFAGWFMDEALTIPYNLTTMPANDVTLYASFNPEA
jgi:uncharacterized repeat protein (TIGR02543 family)